MKYEQPKNLVKQNPISIKESNATSSI